MAGGNFDIGTSKVRPGTYANFKSTRNSAVGISERGIVLIPLLSPKYGPAGEFLTISGAAPDEHIKKLGYSVFDSSDTNALLIRLALIGASKVIVYIPKEGTKASATASPLTATAKYGGSRGNDLKFSVVANAVSGFDVTVYLGTDIVSSYAGLSTVGDLTGKNDAYITFTGTAATALVAIAATSLTGGADATVSANEVTTFLDAAESVRWNCMAFTSTDSSLKASVKTKIKYLIENVGRQVQAVCENFSADYDGIINVTNGVILNDNANTAISAAQVTAYVAGITAGAKPNESNTYVKFAEAAKVNGVKTNEQAIAALNAGEFFFSYDDDGAVIVEQDINSFTSTTTTKGKEFRKNRVIRTIFALTESLHLNIPPNKYDNSEDGWALMVGVGKIILSDFEQMKCLTNVDADADFVVDQSRSVGDETYFIIGVQIVDSAEKLYFSVNIR